MLVVGSTTLPDESTAVRSRQTRRGGLCDARFSRSLSLYPEGYSEFKQLQIITPRQLYTFVYTVRPIALVARTFNGRVNSVNLMLSQAHVGIQRHPTHAALLCPFIQEVVDSCLDLALRHQSLPLDSERSRLSGRSNSVNFEATRSLIPDDNDHCETITRPNQKRLLDTSGLPSPYSPQV